MRRWTIGAVSIFLTPALLIAQSSPVPGLARGEQAEVIFAVQDPAIDKDQLGKPVPQTIEPIAFMVAGQLRQCDSPTSEKDSESTKAAVTDRLRQAYKAGQKYPLWRGGSLRGQMEVTRPCIDESIGLLAACVRIDGKAQQHGMRREMNGISFTGKTPGATHETEILKASIPERSAFVQGVSGILRAQQIRVPESRIRVGDVTRTALRAQHSALAGSALVQIPARERGNFRSYRVFAVLEEEAGKYRPVLSSVTKATILVDPHMQASGPKLELDEGENTDREEFFDSYPAFPDEPDAVITHHFYYEGWSYSIYRWKGDQYQRVYTGCGGGV